MLFIAMKVKSITSAPSHTTHRISQPYRHYITRSWADERPTIFCWALLSHHSSSSTPTAPSTTFAPLQRYSQSSIRTHHYQHQSLAWLP